MTVRSMSRKSLLPAYALSFIGVMSSQSANHRGVRATASEDPGKRRGKGVGMHLEQLGDPGRGQVRGVEQEHLGATTLPGQQRLLSPGIDAMERCRRPRSVQVFGPT